MIALLGYGKTTGAIANRIEESRIFADVERIKQEGNLQILPASLYEPDRFDLAIPSPGMPPSHPLVKSSHTILSDYDYFYDSFPYSIWISGTNGKTTTTQMITHLLHSRGAVSGGNIGTPVASMDEKAPIWVLETSSFTLHYTSVARPSLYVLLPITPDHLSWHGSFEAYEAAKLKPLYNLKEGEIAIVPKQYAHLPTKGMLIGYEDAKELALKMGIDIARVPFEGPFLLDALLALAVSKILFGECEYEKIASFRLDPHKQEEFFDAKGRLWVDDSKATNIDATLSAIRRYEKRPLHLILGGENKGVSLLPLLQKLPPSTKIYAIGKAAQQIYEDARNLGLEVSLCETLERAVEAIERLHTKDSVALLSPACASLDQFSSYKERGEQFKNLVLSKD